MATTIAPPAASSAPPSNYDQIHAALNEPAPEPSQAAASPSSGEPPAETQPEPTESEATAEPGTGEPAEPQAEAAAAEPEPVKEPNPYDEESDGVEQPLTLKQILATRDGQRMYQNHKVVKELAKPWEEGGIGHVPTVQQAREYFVAHRNQAVLDHLATSGDPGKASTWVNHFFGPQADGKLRPNIEVVAASLAPVLAQAPEAYAAAATPFIQNYGAGLWERFEQMPDGQEGSDEHLAKERLYQTCQRIHKDITGSYRTDIGQGATGVASPAADPLAGRQAELDARQADLDARAQAVQQNTLRSAQAAIVHEIASSLDAELEKAIGEQLKVVRESDPEYFSFKKKALHDAVVKDIKADKFRFDLLQLAHEKALRSGNPADRQAVGKEWASAAEPFIRKHRPAIINGANVAAKQASDARHSELRSIDSKKGLSSNGIAPKPSTGPPLQRLPGESQADFNYRQIKALR